MKLNVKGLVFVGFAAAILSANAMAAAGDEKIVTSKAFTEATYQAKTAANKAGQVLKMGSATAGDIDYIAVDTTVTASSDNLVTSGAVATAIASQGLGNTYEVLDNKLDDGAGKTIADNGNSTTLYPSAKAVKTYADSKVSSASTVGTSTTVAPNEKAVSDALATKQANLTGTSSQVTLGNATYKNIASTSAGITTGEDTIPTSGAVADAISGAVTGANLSQYELLSNKVTSLSASSTDDEYPSAKLTYDQLELKQNAADRAAAIVDDGTANDNSASTTKYASNAAVTGYAQKKLSGTSGQVVTYSATAGTLTGTAIDTAVTASSTNLIQSGAVKTYADSKVEDSVNSAHTDIAPSGHAVSVAISNAMGGYTLPTMNADCNAANTHCALVASGDGNGGVTFAWTVMAQ